MWHKRRIWKLAVLGLLGAALALVIACGGKGGVAQSEFDAVKQQLTAKEKEATELQQKLAAVTPAPVATPAPTPLKFVIYPGKPQVNIPLLGGYTNAPPRPTPVPPTPLPAGQTPTPPPPPPTPPPATVVPLYAYIDTVTAGPGESKFNVDANVSCVKSSLFSRGMHIVWRMELVDTATGKVLQGTDVKDATLRLPHGEEAKFRFGRHGATADAPWFWTVAWDVPMDYPLGVLDYTITVTTQDGKSVTVKDPLKVSLANFQPGVNLDTRVTIVPAGG